MNDGITHSISFVMEWRFHYLMEWSFSFHNAYQTYFSPILILFSIPFHPTKRTLMQKPYWLQPKPEGDVSWSLDWKPDLAITAVGWKPVQHILTFFEISSQSSLFPVSFSTIFFSQLSGPWYYIQLSTLFTFLALWSFLENPSLVLENYGSFSI